MKKSRLLGIVCASLIACCPVGIVHASLLYALNDTEDSLVSVDTDTLTITSIGSLGVSTSYGGLAYDPNTDTLYMVGGRGDENLYTVDRTTGQARLIGSHGVTDLFGLAFDSTNNVLFGSQFTSSDDGFHSLNTTTGIATTINPAMTNWIGGLAYDSLRDVLVGIQDGWGDLYAINRSNGAQTLLTIGAFNSDDSGLAYDSDNDLFWAIDYSGNLFSYDPNDGYSRTTALSGLVSHTGLAYISSVPIPPALWLFCSGLIGLAGLARCKTS